MRSNTYTLVFTSVVTIVLGILLALASTALKDRQELNEEMDVKKHILHSLGITPQKTWTSTDIQSIFNQNITGFVIDNSGIVVPGKKPEDLKPDVDIHLHPVFIKQSDGVIEGYAVPISGKGLWSTLYGYLAIEPNGKTVKGITFYKHGETPGLGGEVEKDWFQNNFVGKRFIDDQEKLVSIQIVKGKVDETSSEAYHQVDGISGATMTGRGVTKFLKSNLEVYEPYFRKIRSGGGT
ncbi:MAG: NADH:ubiquinone reductase (Na(+)-transporting) subunit C [Fidelibacterota bacterium]